MENIIKVKLDNEHCFNCSGEILARQNENKATALKILLTKEMLDKWFYIEFTKPDGTKVSTDRLDINIEEEQVVYEITNALTDQVGKITVEIVIRDENNLVWKSYTKTYTIVESINASEEIKEKNPDFITDVAKLENVLKDILEAIQKGGTTANTIEEIENLIVSYFENKTVEEVEA